MHAGAASEMGPGGHDMVMTVALPNAPFPVDCVDSDPVTVASGR